MKPVPEGAVGLFTLKNPSFPEHICVTDSGVMCVDIHPKYPYMLVVGLYDGSVVVFNVQASCKEPAFRSNNIANKHSGIVWQVSKCYLRYWLVHSSEHFLKIIGDNNNGYKN